ncbi:MAG: hypothetical protein RLZ82_68 [Actinomycetota bacterium]|jgi:hypothetical protein
MTEAQFQSRRELRDAESTSATPGQSQDLNFPPLTRSQLIAMGRITDETADLDTASVSTQVHSVDVSSISIPQISTTGVVNPYAPVITKTVQATRVQAAPVQATPVQPASIQEVPIQEVPIQAAPIQSAPIQAVPIQPMPIAQAPVAPASVVPVYEPVLGEAEEPITSQMQLFEVSPNLNVEPQTASIIIDNFEPLDNISIAISETGELLKTGSIELPNFGTNTGEIATILDAAQVDEAISQDSISGYVSTIAPLRASGVVNTAGKIGIMPTKSAKGQGAGYAVLTLSILMIAVGGLVLAAFMLGFLK